MEYEEDQVALAVEALAGKIKDSQFEDLAIVIGGEKPLVVNWLPKTLGFRNLKTGNLENIELQNIVFCAWTKDPEEAIEAYAKTLEQSVEVEQSVAAEVERPSVKPLEAIDLAPSIKAKLLLKGLKTDRDIVAADGILDEFLSSDESESVRLAVGLVREEAEIPSDVAKAVQSTLGKTESEEPEAPKDEVKD